MSIKSWCLNNGMTPEQWLEQYDPHIEVAPDPDQWNVLKFRVTAVPKGEMVFVFKVPA